MQMADKSITTMESILTMQNIKLNQPTKKNIKMPLRILTMVLLIPPEMLSIKVICHPLKIEDIKARRRILIMLNLPFKR